MADLYFVSERFRLSLLVPTVLTGGYGRSADEKSVKPVRETLVVRLCEPVERKCLCTLSSMGILRARGHSKD